MIVLGVNERDDTAVVRVEIMTTAAKEAITINDDEFVCLDDEWDGSNMSNEWFPSDVKTDISLKMLGLRAIL